MHEINPLNIIRLLNDELKEKSFGSTLITIIEIEIKDRILGHFNQY